MSSTHGPIQLIHKNSLRTVLDKARLVIFANLRFMNKYHFFLLITSFLLSCTGKVGTEQPSSNAKNIILFKGDGMGVSQVSASHFFKQGEVNFDRFSHVATLVAKQSLSNCPAIGTSLIRDARPPSFGMTESYSLGALNF